jgi:hypothetical protein
VRKWTCDPGRSFEPGSPVAQECQPGVGKGARSAARASFGAYACGVARMWRPCGKVRHGAWPGKTTGCPTLCHIIERPSWEGMRPKAKRPSGGRPRPRAQPADRVPTPEGDVTMKKTPARPRSSRPASNAPESRSARRSGRRSGTVRKGGRGVIGLRFPPWQFARHLPIRATCGGLVPGAGFDRKPHLMPGRDRPSVRPHHRRAPARPSAMLRGFTQS